MIHLPRAARSLLPALIAAAAVAAVAAPAASAASYPVVILNDQTGVLTYTGNNDNEFVTFSKVPSASTPGSYDLKIKIRTKQAVGASANCDSAGAYPDWVVTCPASKVKQIKFFGNDGGMSFDNQTAIPSEAHGGPFGDTFHGGGGSDRFYGVSGNDTMLGNGGNDILDGGAGFDQMSGGGGTDIASWEDATGPVIATLDGAANDGMQGESENVPSDVEGVQGGGYADKLTGNAGANQLRGGAGTDDLDGKDGADLLNGQAGNDTLRHGPGADSLYGGTETDTLSYAGVGGRVTVFQDFAANDGTSGEGDNVNQVENITGSAYDDELQGTDGNDLIDGGKGFDRITPKYGSDKVLGGDDADLISGGPGLGVCGGFCLADNDVVDGGAGNDTIDYSARSDALMIVLDGVTTSGGTGESDKLTSIENATGGSGSDVIMGTSVANSLTGGAGTDWLEGRAGSDSLAGDAGRDTLLGGADNDYLSGGADDDSLRAFGGTDTLSGGDGRDAVSYADAPSKVVATIGGTGGPSGEADKIEADVEDLEGSNFDDWLIGSDAANTLTGHQGKDVIVGKGGLDVLKGDEGADALNSDGDGLQDHTICGADGDQAKADKVDLVDADCEIVNRV
jgi:Ca2+-binding RTX toxin-like protein